MDANFRCGGVSGAGTMGLGIAITIARAGMDTVLHDISAEALERARRQIGEFFAASVKKGRLSAEDADRAVKQVRYTTALADLADCDAVVEAIYEHLPAKHELLSALNGVCKPETLFLTNTSTLSIAEIAAASGRPERVVGAHYCLPAQLMKLVEMSRGMLTAQASWERAWAFQRATGQLPVETKDRPGFVLNHFCVPYHNDVIRMIEAGVAEPADIDRAVKTAMGFAMGPCELLDLIGLDTQLRASEAFYSVTQNPRTAPPPLLRRMVAAGVLGRKTQHGFYEYN
ncbi:MAG: 3-hydroxyacyl-CoA dehydrogenase family protein, partial [Burkholderiaceae bacterium]|nr:3-hydroxyacyl-CoA dehydrogenase family protein [Burkholderiaceae bacterium]